MIAAELGVTMAAVYHQFRTKDAIIFAAVQSQLVRLEEVVDAAEAEPTKTAARDTLVAGIVEMTMGVGRRVSTVLSDPAVTGTFGGHTGYQALMRRIRRLLMGNDTMEARIRTATFIAAINGTATHPMLAELDDDTLRRELLYVADQLLPSRPRAR
jgi:AcrR family transcriptional regulator